MKQEYIIFGLLIILSFLVGLLVSDYTTKSTTNKLYEKNQNCSNLDLVNTSYCLNEEMNTFFKYNISNKGKDLNLSELKQEGGVCYHASKFYVDNAKELGYNSQIINFWDNNKSIGHSIALVYDNNLDNYCILDQKEIVGCIQLVGKNETNE